MTDIQSPNDKASSYEQTPNDQEGLERAAAQTPIKHYDDYEINIESSGNYEDAIFQDEASLLASLDTRHSAASMQPEPTKTTTEKTTKIHELSSQPTTLAVSFDHFLLQPSSTDVITDLSQAGINHSAPKKFGDDERLIIDKPPKNSGETSTVCSALEQTAQAPQQSLFKRAQKIAQQQFAHGQKLLNEQLGRHLPDRVITLAFQLPAAKPLELPVFDDIKTLLNGPKIKAATLVQLEHALELVVRSNASNGQRSRWLELAIPVLAQRSHALVQVLSRKPLLASEPERQASFYSCLHSLKHCSNLLRQLYNNIYNSSNVLYVQQQHKANGYLQRLVDCLCLEQRLAFAGHGEVSEQQVKTINTLYTVAANYEWHLLDDTFESLTRQGKATLRQLFTHYQLIRKLPQERFCATLQPALLAYIDQHFHYFNVLPLNYQESIPHPCLCITADSGQAPKNRIWNGVQTDTTPATIAIQWQGFINQVRSDYIDMLKQLSDTGMPRRIPPALKKLSPRSQLLLLSLLNQAVTDMSNNRTSPRFSVYQAAQLHSLGSLSALINQQHFNAVIANNHASNKGKTAHNELPERPKHGTKHWGVAHRDQSQWFVCVDERNCALRLNIGEVLMLTEHGDEAKESMISLIRSIERPVNERTQLELQVIGNTCSAIKINSKSHTIDGLIVSQGDHRYLLLAQAPYMKTGTRLAVTFADGMTATAVIAALREVTAEVYRYQLAALM